MNNEIMDITQAQTEEAQRQARAIVELADDVGIAVISAVKAGKSDEDAFYEARDAFINQGFHDRKAANMVRLSMEIFSRRHTGTSMYGEGGALNIINEVTA